MAKIMARHYVTKKTPLLTCGNHALLVLDQPWKGPHGVPLIYSPLCGSNVGQHRLVIEI